MRVLSANRLTRVVDQPARLVQLQELIPPILLELDLINHPVFPNPASDFIEFAIGHAPLQRLLHLLRERIRADPLRRRHRHQVVSRQLS